MKNILIVMLLLFSFNVAFASGIYPGVVDGYAFYINGTPFPEVNINVIVNGCSGSGCSGTYITEPFPSEGYYVVGNLNLPSFGTVTVTGTKDLYTGQATGTANANYIAMVNLTMIMYPGLPSISRISAPHNQTVQLTCTPGIEPNGLTPFVNVRIGNYFETNTSLFNTTSEFDFGTHTWRCRTCNDYVCSAWVQDTFTITNEPPSAPILVIQNATIETTVSLNWNSGIDPEGDATYDEFQFENEAVISPANKPQIISELSPINLYTWRVRTCDEFNACSAWNTSSFIVYEFGDAIPPQLPSPPSSGTGGGIGAIYTPPNYNAFVSYPYYVYQNELINISFFVTSNAQLTDFRVDLFPVYATFLPVDSKIIVENRTATGYFVFNATENSPKNSRFSFVARSGDRIVLERDFSVEVREKPYQELLRERDVQYVVIPIYSLQYSISLLGGILIATALFAWFKHRKR